MTNIIDFPPNRRGLTNPDTDAQAVLAERATALRELLKKNRSMLPADQLAVSEGVWRLLDRLEKQGIKKARVLIEAGFAQKEDSTKWLGQSAVNPEWPEERKATTRLNKRPGRRVRIVDTAARLAGIDPAEALVEVFGATSLAALGNVHSAAPEFEELAKRLRNIAGAVAAKHDLQSYFRDLMRSGNQLLVANHAQETSWDKLAPDNISMHFRKGGGDLDWPIRFRERTGDALRHDHALSIPPYPTLLLGEWSLPMEKPLVLCWDTTDDPHHRKDGQCSFSGGMVCQHTAELRLCVVPVGPDLRPEAALRVKIGSELSTTTFTDEDGTTQAIAFEGVDWVPSQELREIYARVLSNGYRMDCRLWSAEDAVPPLVDQYFPLGRSSHRPACQFLPLTGTVIQDWFSLPAYDFGLQDWHYSRIPVHIRALGAPVFLRITGDDFSPFQANTIAAGLDHCLSGSDGSSPLDLLDTRTEQLVGLFNTASASARESRHAAMIQLDARLRRMRGKGP